MSEVLEIAKALSRSSDSELERVIGIRLMPSANFKDFFDFATALAKPQNVKGAVAGLTRKQIIAFNNLLNGNTSVQDQASLDVLVKLFLVQKTDKGYLPFESASAIFRQLVTKSLLQKLTVDQSIANTEEGLATDRVDPLAGIGAFETVQALTELVIELEHRFVPEVGRGDVSSAELRRLASFLGREVAYAKHLYTLAQIAGLVVLHQKRWRVGREYAAWLSSEPADRWLKLASNWLKLLGPESAAELADETNLDTAIAKNFPLATDGIASHMSNLVFLAELIGLTANGKVSSWYKPLMQGNLAEAKKLIQAQLPKVQNKLILQADLTLISTGPLDTETELTIRRFVDIERIGVASSYRMSALSLSYGMETGLTETEIRSILLKLTGKDLPQPVDYLIRETANRFGRLTLRQTKDGTLIESKESILLASIINDSELRALGLKALTPNSLLTSFDQELVYYQMRENKYPAVALGDSGEVITSWLTPDGFEQSPGRHCVGDDILRWREHDRRMGENPIGDDIVRTLELAIKNKGTVKVTVTDKKMSREFTLEPTGLANGRLRGKDKQADCERVLPLASIVSVAIG
ncbi:MAG: hypothetical protein EBZ61_02435 [Micrococcales bacterium]|nr:hypothetical protein [Micrococcales bacterium]